MEPSGEVLFERSDYCYVKNKNVPRKLQLIDLDEKDGYQVVSAYNVDDERDDIYYHNTLQRAIARLLQLHESSDNPIHVD